LHQKQEKKEAVHREQTREVDEPGKVGNGRELWWFITQKGAVNPRERKKKQASWGGGRGGKGAGYQTPSTEVPKE